MTDGFTCTDKDTLVAYVYGECEAAERQLVEAHLAACVPCAEEVAGLRGVRSVLGAWTVTAPETGVRMVTEAAAAEPPAAAARPVAVLRPARWWQAPLPALGRLAAAILLFAGGAAMANLEIRYDQDGFAIRTGWWREAPAPATTAAASPSPAREASVPAAAPVPWRADLVSLERRLREEFAPGASAASAPRQASGPAALDDRAVMARVDQLIAASEQRQQREMAYRMSEMFGELSAQRQNDLLRVQQGLGALEGTTGAEALRQRQLINYLLTVSEKR
mgnify:CR=1 FL=1